ncbi:MAG: response regulator [Dehalococcoidia bacterium]
MQVRTSVALPRVLVIDDDPSVRRMLRFSLRAAAFDVTEITTGAEAIEILKRQPPEALVLDPGLSDGLGWQVLDRLRELHQQNRTSPAWVVISTLDREDVAKEHGPLGAHFLAKPFDPWQLVRILKEHLYVGKEE